MIFIPDKNILNQSQFSLLDYIPIGIFIIDKKMNVIAWNRCMEHWTKISSDTILSQKIDDFFPDLMKPKYFNRIKQVLRGCSPAIFCSQIHKYLIPCPLPNGEFRIQRTIITPVFHPETNDYDAMFVLQDFTEATHLIKEYKRMRDQAINELHCRIKVEELLFRKTEELEKQNLELIELYNLAITDPLTGLYNRRYLDNILEQEFNEAKRLNHTISIIMIDLDHFKNINDTFGHKIGDLFLVNTSKILLEKTRKSDFVCRYGGEELTIILPKTSLINAQRKAEEIRLAIKNMTLTDENNILPHITASFGVANFPNNGLTYKAVLQEADHALYQAKINGRDNIVTANINSS